MQGISLGKVGIDPAGLLGRRGEGSVAGEFNKDFLEGDVSTGYEEPFPYGTKEKTINPGLSIDFNAGRHLRLSADIQYFNFNNYKNQSQTSCLICFP